MAPLVMMFVQMILDLLQFLLLLLPLLLGFAAAFKLMYANAANDSARSGMSAECRETMSVFDSWISTGQARSSSRYLTCK